MTNWFLFKAYVIQKLPLAFLIGFKIVELDESKCVTYVKYRYLNKNPFRSTYWAVLGMAAELSTGA
ncbi:MAG TPA: thioesterase, partial [Candidatus Thioglobus sp.]|nr:thioesterase [Candidatus Thioglobus sp.]